MQEAGSEAQRRRSAFTPAWRFDAERVGNPRLPRAQANATRSQAWQRRRAWRAVNPYPTLRRRITASLGLAVLTAVLGVVVALCAGAVLVGAYVAIAHAVNS